MPTAQIVSTGGYLPGAPVTNERVEQLVGPLPEGLLEGMHMEERYWVVDPDTGEHRDTTAGMAAKATAQALDRAGIEPADLDLLITATASPDYMLPPAVALVQEMLDIPRCALLELRSGGAGMVQGLDLARLYIESGQYRTAAVVGCDAISPLQAELFLGDDKRLRVRERLLTYMFGDGAGTVVMRAGEDGGVLGSAMAGIGTGRPPGMQVLGGAGTYAPYAEQRQMPRLVDMHIDIKAASTFTGALLGEAVQDTLRATGVSVDEIDLLVTPEADADWMSEAMSQGVPAAAEWADLEGKVYNALHALGAPGCAALPLGLDRAWTSGRLNPGDRVMLIGMETTKWIYAGMVADWTAEGP